MYLKTMSKTMGTIFCLLFSVVFCEQYTSKFDNINIDEVLRSERLLKNYFNCLMSRGPCTPDGDELKKILPHALQTACANCNDKQRDGTKKIVRFLIENQSEMWKELSAKYDPDNHYFEKYKSELEA